MMVFWERRAMDPGLGGLGAVLVGASKGIGTNPFIDGGVTKRVRC
jgi:hypothetical protein